MPRRATSRFVLGRLLVAVAAVVGASIAVASRARADTPPTVIEDADYRFRLQAPGRGWRLLPEGEARRMVPDAVAGAARDEGVFGAVIVEEAGGTALGDLPKILIDNMAIEDREVSAPEPIDLLGRKALRWTTTGRANGVPMRYQHIVFLNQGYAYQLVAWGIASAVAEDGSSFAPFVDAFWLLEGPVKARATTPMTPDATGVGWHVKDGVFQSGAYRIEVKPPPDWRLAVGAELRGINPNAEVGLVASNPERYVILILERASGEDHESFLGHVDEGFRQRIGGESREGRLPVSIDGRAVPLHEIGVVGPPAVDFFHGAFFEGDLCVQVLGWYVTSARERARDTLAEAFTGMRFLDAGEAARLNADLEGGPDLQNRVAEGWSIRRGTYRDFEHGFTWTKPAGWWRLRAGKDARDANALAVLHLEEPSRGILGLVLAEPLEQAMDDRTFHQLVVRNVFGDAPPAGEPEPFELGEGAALATSGRRTTDGITFRWRVASVVHRKTGFQILLWGTVDNMKSSARAVEAAIQGFRFVKDLAPTETDEDGTFRDVRVGFAMAPLGEGWRIDTTGMADLGAIGTRVTWRLPDREEVILGALCALEEGQDEAWMLDFLTKMVEEGLRKGAGEATGLLGRDAARAPKGAPTREPTTLGGLPAQRLRWPGLEGLEVVLTHRDRTFYFLVVEHRGEPALSLEQVAARFSLLDGEPAVATASSRR